MKRTLRFTCLVLAALAMGIVANAQRAIPLSISFTSPTQNQEIEYEENYYLILKINNLSQTETLLATDTVFILLEGEPDFPYDGNFFAIMATQNIEPGGEGSYPIFGNGNLNNTGSIISKEYCAVVCGAANFWPTGSWYNSVADPFEPSCVSFKLMPQGGSTPASVNELDAAAFSIYPNPANEVINISTENLPADAIIIVHNAMGQRVFAQKANDFRASGSIHTAEWNSGIYMVTITANGVSTTQRVTVQH
ncbi:MAG TPA: T9SS type A sorting domain-containing protein [Flavobacteriales bacterium]